ncbi:unnamed protein product [Arabis nemorensis]|uniref:Uncharacterized protein n=1 Tax=Arabis nemorensis TaxID=586526 RepID=A0A565C724_9BRAS|nr:unnamed protein product [Arabis nemorensis]
MSTLRKDSKPLTMSSSCIDATILNCARARPKGLNPGKQITHIKQLQHSVACHIRICSSFYSRKKEHGILLLEELEHEHAKLKVNSTKSIVLTKKKDTCEASHKKKNIDVVIDQKHIRRSEGDDADPRIPKRSDGAHEAEARAGRNRKLVRVEKYNKTTHLAAGFYFITLVAKDAATDVHKTFQTRVDEEALGQFMLTCHIARLREDPKISPNYAFFEDDLPEFPTENPFQNTKPFHMLTESELQDNYDWIHLYVELATGTSKRGGMSPEYMSTLNIVEVAMDTTEDANGEGLNAKKAIFYIRYVDSEDVDRIAIVRRAFDEQTGCFSLVGRKRKNCFLKFGLRSETIPKSCFLSSETIPTKRKIRSALRLGVCKPWRFSSHRLHKVFKNSGLGLARSRRPHKTRSN